MRQTCPAVRDKSACTLESENSSEGFWCDADGISKAFTEMTAAVTGFVRKCFHRVGSMCLPESSPGPGDFWVDRGRPQAGDQLVVQDRKSLVPSPRSAKPFHEIQRSRSPHVGETHHGRCYFDARDSKYRPNTEWFDADIQHERLVPLAHACRSTLQTVHKSTKDTRYLSRVWHLRHHDRLAQADDQVKFARR